MVFDHPVRRVDEQFLKDAPVVVRVAVDVDATPAQVFEALGSDRMFSWTPLLDKVTWLTPRPLTQGCIRTLRAGRFVEVEEEFFIWEENRRAAFCVTSATRPAVKALAEDFLVEPTSRGTRLTWTMAFDPGLPVPRPLGRLIAALMAPGSRFVIGGIRKIIRPEVAAPAAPQAAGVA